MTIKQGKYTARIHSQQGRFIVLVTYEEEVLPGTPCKFYATHKAAERGAARMLAKVAV